MSYLYRYRREIQPDIVVGINLLTSEYLQMSTRLVIFDKFSSTEGQCSRGQMREAEELWRIVLLSWFIVNNELLAFTSIPSTMYIWGLLWKLCTDWLISFHCLRSGCSLKLTGWLCNTLTCCHCLDLCKKAALELPFGTSSREVIKILPNSLLPSSNPIKAVISISQQQRDKSDMSRSACLALPSDVKKMAALVSVWVCLLSFSVYPIIKHTSFNFICFYHSYLSFFLTYCKLESWKSSLDGQLLPSL